MNKLEQVMDVNEVSHIAQGAEIKGDIISVSDMRLDGKVDGSLVSCGRVVVGEKAVIKGVMVCGETDFWGTLEGDLYVKDILSLKSSAVINGNIHIRKLQVEMGAGINGTCHMISEEEFEKLSSSVSKRPSKKENTASKKVETLPEDTLL